MIVEGQIYKTKWSGTNKKWYESKGYVFTKNLNDLEVDMKDLMPSSRAHFLSKCDNPDCDAIFNISCRTYYLNLQNSLESYCKDCMYINIGRNKIKKHKDKLYNYLKIYKQILQGDIEKFPDGFVTHMKIEDAKVLVLYLIEYLKDNNLVNVDKNISKFLSYELLSQYHLITVLNKFGLHDLLSYSCKDIFHPWELQYKAKDFWDKKKNVVATTEWFLSKLSEDGTIKDLGRLPKISYKNKFSEYGISGLYSKFQNSFPKLMEYVYPGKYNEWDFIVPNNYYKTDQNKKKILDWFINKLYEDHIISCEEDIPKVIDGELFRKYNLGSFFTKSFSDSTFDAVNYIYPNRWKQWEYKRVPNDYWNNPQNVRDCLMWVAEKMLNESIIKSKDEILSCDLREIFENFQLSSLYIKYDVRFMYTLVYGDIVDYHGKSVVSGKDGTKLDSLDEKFIHDILLTQFDSVYKPIKGDKFNYRNKDESYIPDWIVNENIIIEYFGLYSTLNSNNTLRKYAEKTKRKIEYFSNLNDYVFIPLFKEDLKNNCTPLKEKLNSI